MEIDKGKRQVFPSFKSLSFFIELRRLARFSRPHVLTVQIMGLVINSIFLSIRLFEIRIVCMYVLSVR